MERTGDPAIRRRVDGSHRARTKSPAVPARANSPEYAAKALVGEDLAVAKEQLYRQASQLGDRLRTQLRDLDSRESEFHARIAQMENELRTARLIYREKDHNVELQQEKLQKRLRDSGSDSVVRMHNAEHFRIFAPDGETSAGGFQPGVIAYADQPGGQRKQLTLHQLEAQEKELQSRLANVTNQQQDLARQRKSMDQQRDLLTDQAEEERKKTRREFDRERLRLRQRSEAVERKAMVVRQMQEETSDMPREALELRICAEALRAQLDEKASAVEVTKQLGELRRQLDDQYRLASDSLKEQQTELQTLIAKLETHESRMSKQRDEVRGWVSRRQQEIEDQAAKLLQRERELSRQESSFLDLESTWQLQRDSYEQQIRELKRLMADHS